MLLASTTTSCVTSLILWCGRLGSNDAVWRGIADNAKEMLTGAVKRLKAANADVILVICNMLRSVLLTSRHARMEKIIAEVAREQNVGTVSAIYAYEEGDRWRCERPCRMGRPSQDRRRP